MSTLAAAPSVRIALTDVLRTARVAKIAPVPMLTWSGYALAHGRDVSRIAWVTLGVVAVTLLVTRLNVLTDESLDKDTRPELARSLRRSSSWIAAVSGLELLALVLTLAVIDGDARWALVGLLAFGVLYSFNFLSPHPVRGRWKAHWLGHGIAFVGSYLALWGAGAWAATPLHAAPVLLVALATGVSDYAVYIGECAIDHEQEARSGLKTAAALLGPRAAALAALALFAIGVALHVPWLTLALAAVFVPPLVLRGAMLGWLAAAELTGRSELARALRLHAADGVFLGARVWTFGALMLSGWASSA